MLSFVFNMKTENKSTNPTEMNSEQRKYFVNETEKIFFFYSDCVFLSLNADTNRMGFNRFEIFNVYLKRFRQQRY